jgi:anti-anti-sigma factor
MKPQLFPSLHGYERSWLRGDVIAGLTVWAVLVPEALDLRAAVRTAAAPDDVHTMVIDAEAISFIDVTAAAVLATLHLDLRAEGVELLVAHDIGQVRDTLEETGTDDELRDRHIYPSVSAAVAAAGRVDVRHHQGSGARSEARHAGGRSWLRNAATASAVVG